MRIQRINWCYCLALIVSPATFPSFAEESRWWPIQAMPKSLVRTEIQDDSLSRRMSYEMMAQSVAGLAAKCVNEGHGDEMVWVTTGTIDYEDWLARLLARESQLRMRGTFGVWDLVDRFAKKSCIKGYLLYRSDKSKGELNTHRAGMDCSVNVATSLA